MEILRQLNTQVWFPVAAVAVVLVCAALVFIFGFHSAEQPQFDKHPLILDDRKSAKAKRKTKEKKSSPNRVTSEDSKTKSESKKSPTKEKKEDKQKEVEKPKPKDKVIESKIKKDSVAETKKGKKNKSGDLEKPVDFDDAGWQEVPKKSDKKKVKPSEEKEKEKKGSPINKKTKKKAVKDADIEAAHPAEEVVEDLSDVVTAEDEDVASELLAKVKEFQRVLREAELREQAALGEVAVEENEEEAVEELTDVKDLRTKKLKENKEKQDKKKATEAATLAKAAAKVETAEKEITNSFEKPEDKPNVPVFDELGDTWTDAKAKKGKKKARKDQ